MIENEEKERPCVRKTKILSSRKVVFKVDEATSPNTTQNCPFYRIKSVKYNKYEDVNVDSNSNNNAM